jgi:hypothetical protein
MYLILFGIAIMTSQLVLIVSAAETHCLKVAAKFDDGFCKGTSVWKKFCVDPTLANTIERANKDDLKSLGGSYSETECDSFYTTINANVAAGCAKMAADSMHNPSTCDKSEYCGTIIRSQITESSTCSKSSECPGSASSDAPGKVICCDFYRRKLESQCSKQDATQLGMYITDLKTTGKCRDTNCHGTGSSIRVVRFTILVSAVVALSMAYVF